MPKKYTIVQRCKVIPRFSSSTSKAEVQARKKGQKAPIVAIKSWPRQGRLPLFRSLKNQSPVNKLFPY